MAILKNLLVNGSARFLNTLYANDLTVSGTTTFADLSVTGNAVVGGTLNVGNGNNANTIIKLNGKQAIAGVNGTSYTWLRINDTNAFTSGVYFGSSIVRTDGSFQIGNAGANINMTTSAATFKVPININGTTYKWTTDGNINANGITATNANINKGIFHNAVVEGTLYAVHQEIDHVANLGGVFLVTPTVKCISSGSNKTLTSVTVTASSTTRTNSDGESVTYNYSLQINDSAFSTASIGGNNWVQYGEIKVNGNINGTVLGTCDGFIQSINTNTHVLTVAIKYNGDQTLATPSDISTVEDLNIMLKTVYDSSQSKHYPVGIWMKSRDANGYSHISLYGGTSVDPTVRIGNLQGCPTINGESPTGWGIFTNNGYFSGMIVSNSGKIGNFTISDALYSTAKAFGTTANNVYIGDDGISLGTTFKVTKAGSLTATSGSIGGWTIGTSDIHSGTHSAWNTASDGLFLGTTKIAGGNGGTWYLNNDGTGKIGRFTFSSGGEFTTTVSNNTAGMGNGTYAFWAGATSANAASAPFRVTYAGAITATSGSIGGSVTIGGTAASTILSDITNAAKTATNYVTKIDSAGIFISPENQSPTTTAPGDSLLINGSGMEIYKAGTSVASYGDTTRIGKLDSGNLIARSTGIAVRDGLKELTKINSDGVFLGENDQVIISPTGSTKYIWDQSLVGEYSVSSNDSQTMIDVTGNAMYDALSDGDQFWFGVVETGSTAILSVVFTKGTQENKNSLNFRFKYDGAGSVNIRPYSSTITSIQLYVRLRTTLYGGIFSFGANNTATGFFSATLGEGLAASQENQVVIGRYNQDNQQALFMIGNGENVDGEITRSNALVVSPNGDMHHYGSRFITDGDCDFGDTLRKNGYQFIETDSIDLGTISITAGTPGTASTTITKTITKTGYTPIAVKIRYVSNSIIGFNAFFSEGNASLYVQVIRRQTGASSPGYKAYADVTYIKT